MSTAFQVALSILLNLIPAGGVIFRGWTPATALTLYWCENLVGAVLMSIRIAAHRRLTMRRGHFRHQVNQADGAPSKPSSWTYTREFTSLSLVFTMAHGIFLAAVLGLVVEEGPDRRELIDGLPWMVAALLAGFAIDLSTLRDWTFAELKRRADRAMGRIVLIHLSILGGMFLTAFSSRPKLFFSVFGALKTLADVAGLIPYHPPASAEAPTWFLRFAGLFGGGKHWETGQDPATWWRETGKQERRRVEEDEQVIRPARGRDPSARRPKR